MNLLKLISLTNYKIFSLKYNPTAIIKISATKSLFSLHQPTMPEFYSLIFYYYYLLLLGYFRFVIYELIEAEVVIAELESIYNPLLSFIYFCYSSNCSCSNVLGHSNTLF